MRWLWAVVWLRILVTGAAPHALDEPASARPQQAIRLSPVSPAALPHAGLQECARRWDAPIAPDDRERVVRLLAVRGTWSLWHLRKHDNDELVRLCRVLEDSPPPSVEDCAAAGDGSTDDAGALQACINKAEVVVLKPYGTYRLEEGTLAVLDGVHMIQGQGASLECSDDHQGIVVGDALPGRRTLVLQDLRLIRCGIALLGSTVTLALRNSSVDGNGIRTGRVPSGAQSEQSVLLDQASWIRGGFYGIWLCPKRLRMTVASGCSVVLSDRSYISEVYVDGWDIWGAIELGVLTDLRATTSSSEHALHIDGGAAIFNISGDGSDGAHAAYVEGPQALVQIHDADIHDNDGGSLRMMDAPGSEVFIEAATLHDQGASGLLFTRCDDLTLQVSRSLVRDNDGRGIEVGMSCRVVFRLVDSTIQGSGRSGIRFERVQDASAMLQRAHIVGGQSSGFEVQYSHDVIVDLDLSVSINHNWLEGLAIRGGSSVTVRMSGNSSIHGNGKAQIEFESGVGHSLEMHPDSSIYRSPRECIYSGRASQLKAVSIVGASLDTCNGPGIVCNSLETLVLEDARVSSAGAGISAFGLRSAMLRRVKVRSDEGAGIVLRTGAGGLDLDTTDVHIQSAGTGMAVRATRWQGRRVNVVGSRGALELQVSQSLNLKEMRMVGNREGLRCIPGTLSSAVFEGVVYLNKEFDVDCEYFRVRTSPILRLHSWWLPVYLTVSGMLAAVTAVLAGFLQERPKRLADITWTSSICGTVGSILVIGNAICIARVNHLTDPKKFGWDEDPTAVVSEKISYFNTLWWIYGISCATAFVCVPVVWWGVARRARLKALKAAQLEIRVETEMAMRQWMERHTRAQNEREVMIRAKVEDAIAQGDERMKADAVHALYTFGWSESQAAEYVDEVERRQSEEGGICVEYLLSDDFLELAERVTGKRNPTFYDMKDPLFKGDDAIGADAICPRDKRPGCAMIDALPRVYRRKCTHFLSWTWGYRVEMLRDTIEDWIDAERLRASEIFFFVCFFCNNQYRILVEESQSGSDNLESTFEGRLRRIGRVVAVLDDWDEPQYLTRVWTIFEQYTAAKLNLHMTVVIPPEPAQTLIAEFEKGRAGIERVQSALQKVNSESAQAYKKTDEEKVKKLIRETIGFEAVNQAVMDSLLQWVSLKIQVHMKRLVMRGTLLDDDEFDDDPPSALGTASEAMSEERSTQSCGRRMQRKSTMLSYVPKLRPQQSHLLLSKEFSLTKPLPLSRHLSLRPASEAKMSAF